MAGPTDRQAIFAGVLLLANRMQVYYDARLEDLTLKQWLALVVIQNLPQPVPSTAILSGILGTSHQNVSKLLAALETKGYVRLAPSPADRRARQVSLTERSRASLASNQERGERLLDELFAEVSGADAAACLRVLNSMSEALTGEGLVPEESRS